MKKKIVLMVLCITFICISGCQRSTDTQENIPNEEGEEVENPFMTAEYLIENCGISEKDLKDVDVEEFVKTYELRKGDEESWDILFLLESYKGQYAEKESPYAYLLSSDYEENGIREDDIPSVKSVVMYVTKGTYQETIILDMDDNKGYWGKESDMLLGWNEDCLTISLDEKGNTLINALKENQIWLWDTSYEGSSEGTTGDFGWSVFIELNNGKVYLYSGNGVQGNKEPKQRQALEKALKELFGE